MEETDAGSAARQYRRLSRENTDYSFGALLATVGCLMIAGFTSFAATGTVDSEGTTWSFLILLFVGFFPRLCYGIGE
jgi:hypothetical protein